MQVRSLDQEDSLEEGMEPTPVFLPGESHGQRSLAGYSPGVAKCQTQLSDFHTSVQFSSVQSLSRVRLLATSGIAAHQASLSITNSQSSVKLTSIESVMHSAISSSVVPLSSCPQSLPASESFPVSQLFA